MAAEQRLAAILVAALFTIAPAHALVGTATPDPAARGIVMVLASGSGSAGFCSGIALAPDVVLTAAHCVRNAAGTRVHLADTPGAPALLPVREIAIHPGYRSDAVQARVRSVDLAVLRLEQPLPPSIRPVEIAPSAQQIAPGDDVRMLGYGLSREGDPRSGGTLRAGAARVRGPHSDLLLWLEGPTYACTGDSGGAVLDEGGTLLGLIAWASGPPGHACGALTQAIRLTSARGWIADRLNAWRR